MERFTARIGSELDGSVHRGQNRAVVRDDYHRCSLIYFSEVARDVFCSAIERGGRFVEDVYPAHVQHGPRNGDPLLLAARQLRPAAFGWA